MPSSISSKFVISADYHHLNTISIYCEFWLKHTNWTSAFKLFFHCGTVLLNCCTERLNVVTVTQNTSTHREMNSLTHEMPFCVITYNSYKHSSFLVHLVGGRDDGKWGHCLHGRSHTFKSKMGSSQRVDSVPWHTVLQLQSASWTQCLLVSRDLASCGASSPTQTPCCLAHRRRSHQTM